MEQDSASVSHHQEILIEQSTDSLENYPVILLRSENQPSQIEVVNDADATSELTLWSPPATPLSSQSTVTVDSDITVSNELTEFVVTSVDVKAILSNDFVGNALLLKGLNRILSNSDRDRIADILISAFLNTYKGRLNHQHFRIIAQKIATLIPGEKVTTYFVEPIKKKDSPRKHSEPARGKLIEKYRNKLHLIKKLKKVTSEALKEIPVPTKINLVSYCFYSIIIIIIRLYLIT